VLDCISKFSQLEVIAGWKCPKCQSTEGANKTQSIYQASKVLIVYFKRFQSAFENGQLKQEKLNHHIDFPQILDLSTIIDVP
jgi:ubiquitin C-terminal hydrolase